MSLLLLPMVALFQLAAATPPVVAADAPTCRSDAHGCPDWMPSQAQMRSAIADYFCEEVDRGRIAPAALGPVTTDTSNIACSALDTSPGGNFVCGGEFRFIHRDGTRKAYSFSPTLHHDAQGRIAFYRGDDEAGKAIWRVPAPRDTSRYCATRR